MENKHIIFPSHISYNIPLAYIVPECWKHYSISLYFPRDSKIAADFDREIGRLIQSGLIHKWKKDEMDKVTQTRNPQSFSLGRDTLMIEDIIVSFIVLVIGYVLSCLAFLVELVLTSFCKK